MDHVILIGWECQASKVVLMLRDLFTLSKREQAGLLILFIILLITLIPFLIEPKEREYVVDKELQNWLDQMEVVDVARYHDNSCKCFSFDPNIVTVNEMEDLGFSKNAIINLIKYRESGGRFNKAEKLAAIYGVDSVLFRKLKPFVEIKHQSKLSKRQKNVSQQESNYNELNNDYTPKYKSHINDDKSFVVELNSADTAMLALLKGIGPVLSRRIVAYRKKIGGFYSVNQLNEVYGITSEVVQDNKDYIIVDAALIKPLNINTASLRKIKNHPYFDFYQAKEIYELRHSEGINSLQQVFSLETFKDQDSTFLSKYITISN